MPTTALRRSHSPERKRQHRAAGSFSTLGDSISTSSRRVASMRGSCGRSKDRKVLERALGVIARDIITGTAGEWAEVTFGVVEDKLLGTPKLHIIRSLWIRVKAPQSGDGGRRSGYVTG